MLFEKEISNKNIIYHSVYCDGKLHVCNTANMQFCINVWPYLRRSLHSLQVDIGRNKLHTKQKNVQRKIKWNDDRVKIEIHTDRSRNLTKLENSYLCVCVYVFVWVWWQHIHNWEIVYYKIENVIYANVYLTIHYDKVSGRKLFRQRWRRWRRRDSAYSGWFSCIYSGW